MESMSKGKIFLYTFLSSSFVASMFLGEAFGWDLGGGRILLWMLLPVTTLIFSMAVGMFFGKDK